MLTSGFRLPSTFGLTLTCLPAMYLHGTTRRQVGRVFREVERPALQPFPSTQLSTGFQDRNRQPAQRAAMLRLACPQTQKRLREPIKRE